MRMGTYTGAFLSNGNKVLLIRRGMHKKIAPGKVACIGGRIENHEMSGEIESALFREIFEESGIPAERVSNLWLAYMITSNEDNTLYTTYIFFGETDCIDLVQSHEGELFWADKSELATQDFSLSYTRIIEHYLARKADDFGLYVAVINESAGDLGINWIRMDERKRNEWYN